MNASGNLSISYPDGYTLCTDRLLLRAPQAADTDGLWPHVTNPDVTEFLAWEPHESKDVTRSVLASLASSQQEEKGFHWLLQFEAQPIGIISLIDVRRQHRCWTLDRAELAYWLAPEFQKRGLVTEGCHAVLAFAFDRLHFHKIVVYHASDNPPSGAVVERLGFRCVGEELEAFCKHGVWHHLKQYEMLASEFTSTSTPPSQS